MELLHIFVELWINQKYIQNSKHKVMIFLFLFEYVLSTELYLHFDLNLNFFST